MNEYLDKQGLETVSDEFKEYVDANVNIPRPVATALEMNALLTEENVGKAFLFTGTTDADYTQGDVYIVESAV